MSIAIFDKFKNFIPTTIVDGADVSMVILVDPPSELPAVFLADKGVLDTANKKIKVYNETGAEVIHEFDISETDLKPIEEEISALDGRVSTLETDNATNKSDISTIKTDIGNLKTGVSDNASDIASNASDIQGLQGSIGDQNTEINAIKITLGNVETTANNADSLSKTNAGKLDNALLSDEYGWNINKLNVYNVSRISRTNNAVNSSGVSIGDVDVNLHGDTVGITSSNSASTYAVFSAGGLNINDYPLTRMGSGGDTDTNGANIGDVKRIATDGSGLKPTGEEWDMLGYPIINIGTSEVETSASTVGQVNAVKTTADAADTLSKNNAQRLDNLPPAPDLDGYVKNGEDVNFGTAEINIVKVTKGDDKTKFSDILIDGNTNTEMNFVGDTHFYVRDKADNSKGLEAFQIDSSARFVIKQKVKTPVITNLSTGTTNSNTDNSGFIDLSTPGEVKLGAKSNVTFNVAGNGIIEVAAAGLKFLRDVNANNHTISKMGDLKFSAGYQIEGSSTGNLKIRNADGLYKNDSTDNNSIRFEGDDLRYKAAHHMFFKNASESQIFGVSDAGANLFNHNIIKVKHLLGNTVGAMNVANVHIIKRDDGKDTNQSIQLNASDLSYYSDKHEFKTNGNARRLTIEDHAADWHDCILSNVKDAVANKDVPNLAQVNALIAASGGGGVEYENYIIRSQDGSHTFYETTSTEKNAWVVATNNNAGTLTYTFDYSRNGQEVVAGLENKTKRTIIVRMQLRQSTVLTVEVPAYSVFTTRYVPDIGHYVYNIGTWYPTEQRVITLEDINPQISSDYKQMTKNIIAAMPNHTTLIGYHNPDIDGASKYKFVTRGKTGTEKEVSKCSVVIHKHTSNHAVGLSTTEGSGRVYSRVLDGTTGIWNTNDTSASFALEEDIPLDEIPEDQIFFTGDKGILESYVIDGETNEIGLRPLDGYNVPKHDSDIAALGVQTEKNRSVTNYFVNESQLSYDWPDEERRPLVEVQVLNTTQKINNSSVTVTDNAEHKYSGEYNTVGSVAINASGNWANVYVYHNAYKHESENYYVVFNQATTTWNIIEAENEHTSIGSKAAAVTVALGSATSLPASFGNYVIDTNFDNIDSLEFFTAEVPVQYDDVNSRVIINFNGSHPSGFVTLK